MKTLRTDAAIDTCRGYSKSTSNADPEVESILVSHACVIAYAEIEAHVKRTLRERILRETGGALPGYASQTVERLVRSIKISELSKYAKWFGPDVFSDFKGRTTDEALAAWDSLLGTRHSSAHEEADGTEAPPAITLGDLVGYLAQCKAVFDAFDQAIQGASGHE